jgi:eukaryotic-like serine/threonine-protein kinase
MTNEVTVESLLDLLGQSDLVSDAQLLALTTEFLGEGPRPESAQKLADELVKRGVLTTWQAENLLQGKHRGYRLGPYRILRPLGQGGMSKVFLAEHEMMRRRSAIKVLPSKYQEDPDLLKRFHLEARAVAALDHPNIVRAYDFNKDVRYGKEIHYLVMEYVEGSDLRRMVEEHGPLDCRKAADFVCQAAEGLAHAHAAGFVHRDIKPANLLVDLHGVLKILDLGLATVTIEAEKALNPTESGQSAVGTADYVPPEQVIDSRNVDGRADIYSLGLTFYFLLTGHRPFAKPTIMEVLMAHRTEKPEPISKFRPDVPLDLEAIIDKMIAKSPQQRPQTAKEVAEKLRKWLSDAGSGRTYSRLSALMAEASRAKHPAGQEPRPADSKSGATTELELVAVDDAPARAQEPPGAKPTEGQALETAELTLAAAEETNRQAVAKDKAIPTARKLEPTEVKGTTDGKGVREKPAPGGASNQAAPPSSKTDLLAGLLEEDLLSELPAVEGLGLPGGQGPLQPFAPGRLKNRGDLGELLKSPWVWVGLVAVGLLVLVVVLTIAFSSPSEPISGDHPANEPVASAPPSEAHPTPPPTVTPTLGPKPPEPPPALPPKIEGAKVPGKGQEIPSVLRELPQFLKPSAPTPKPSPPPAATTTQTPEPPKPPEIPISPDNMLAGLKTISVRLTKSIIPNPKAPLNTAIIAQVEGAARHFGVEVTPKSPNVMEIALNQTNGKGGALTVVLSAELKCTAQDGKEITVWKKSEQVFSGKLQKMNPTVAMQTLGKHIDRLCEQLAADVTLARAKVGKQ